MAEGTTGSETAGGSTQKQQRDEVDHDCRPGEERMMTTSEGRFEFGGVNHLALVCRDMERTVDFYSGVLGMPLIKTIELPAGMGQHFFFDCGGDDALAFFWFPDAPEPAPGVSAPTGRPDQGSLTSAIGSMNHVAFSVPADRIDEYRERLVAAGVGVHRGGQPRRQRMGHRRRGAPGGLRPIRLLPGSRRHPPRAGLLDPTVGRRGRTPPTGPGRRPGRRLSPSCRDCARSRGPRPPLPS